MSWKLSGNCSGVQPVADAALPADGTGPPVVTCPDAVHTPRVPTPFTSKTPNTGVTM